jgi:hypothetical protein
MKALFRSRSVRVAVFALAGALLGGGSFAAYSYAAKSDDCCAQNAPCCYPGSPCCARNGAHRG